MSFYNHSPLMIIVWGKNVDGNNQPQRDNDTTRTGNINSTKKK
jgi:hypothetical protein